MYVYPVKLFSWYTTGVGVSMLILSLVHDWWQIVWMTIESRPSLIWCIKGSRIKQRYFSWKPCWVKFHLKPPLGHSSCFFILLWKLEVCFKCFHPILDNFVCPIRKTSARRSLPHPGRAETTADVVSAWSMILSLILVTGGTCELMLFWLQEVGRQKGI